MGTSGGSFLDTRVSLFAERLLRRPRREALLSATDREALAPLLREAGLERLLTLPSNPMALEQGLASVLVEETLRLTHGTDHRGAAFLRLWTRRLELVNLKIILRSRLLGRAGSEVVETLLDLGPLTSLPLHALTATDSPEELLRRLEDSPYSEMARQARKVYESEGRLFDAEAILDSHYLQRLVHQARALPGRDGDRVRALLGAWLDLVNLVSLLRYRLTYRLEAPHAYFLLAPGGRLLSPSVLQELAAQDGLEAVLARLPHPLAAKLDGAPDIDTVEQRLIAGVRTAARRVLRRRNPPLARAFAWLYLREQQLRLVHTVLKGHLLHLDPALIRFCAEPLAEGHDLGGERP